MKTNMGFYDRIIRAVVGAVLLALYFTSMVAGNLALILAGVGVVMLATSALAFCPAYFPFRISTKK